MVRTPSTMLPLGTHAADFSLLDVSGRTMNWKDVAGEHGTVVMFICNHCPFVKHVADELARLGHEYMPRGIGLVAISSNDVSTHPADSPEQMVHEAEQRGYPFPYLYDETQEWPRNIALPARRTFICSIETRSWSIAASLMTAVRTVGYR